MRKKRLLIVGCGDVMTRALPWLQRRFRVYALVRSPVTAATLRSMGVTPILGDLDEHASLTRLAGLGHYLIHSAPPPNHGRRDTRTRALIASLRQSSILPRGVAYISTTGVYGDAAGAFIDETQPIRPLSDRAVRRADAEGQLRHWGRRGTHVALLRAPGIYAANRLPVDRIQTGTPAILDAEDSYSNHIHADDLAMAAALALFRGKAQRVYNACDHSRWKMGEWFDRVADACGLARPPRLSRAEAKARVSPALWSFMRESRQLDNTRLRCELRIRLCYSTPEVLLKALADQLRKS